MQKGTLKKVTFAILILFMVLADAAATQYFASKLGYQEALGEPLFTFHKWPIYEPFHFWVWFFRFYK